MEPTATHALPAALQALRLSDYTYELPPERIAEEPLADRTAARLLVDDGHALHDHRFRELPNLLRPGSLLVMNDSRVVPARLVFQRSTGARIEVFCLAAATGQPIETALQAGSPQRWQCLVGNRKRWRPDEPLRLEATDGTRLEARQAAASPEEIDFRWDPPERPFAAVMDAMGHTPLPPYIKREARAEDRERYQTVYAREAGSVAAPTAGLHFTPELLAELRQAGIRQESLSLHVGAGTFQPITREHIVEHRMHAERVVIGRGSLETLLNQAQQQAPVVATGTTSLRLLESLYWFGHQLAQGHSTEALWVEQWAPYRQEARLSRAEALEAVLEWLARQGRDELSGATQVMIAPPYRLRMADALITNFHQPGSSLLLLIAAVLGERWREVYAHALRKGYRFLSYGDTSLLWTRPEA